MSIFYLLSVHVCICSQKIISKKKLSWILNESTTDVSKTAETDGSYYITIHTILEDESWIKIWQVLQKSPNADDDEVSKTIIDDAG